MIAWFRRVYDPWLMLGYWLMWLLPFAAVLLVMFGFTEHGPSADARQMLTVFPALGLFGYGAVRGFIFHPLFRDDYRRWLEMTPWMPGRRLPLGALHPVWQDAILAALFVAPAAILNGSEAFLILVAGALGYLIGPIAVFAHAGPRGHLYAILGLIVVGAFAASFHYGYAAPVALVAILVAHHGLQANLARFPWPEQFPAYEANFQHGWPYHQLDARRKPDRIANWECPVIGLLVGSALFVGLWINWFLVRPPYLVIEPSIDRSFAEGCLVPFFGVALIVRLIWMVYCAPPISLLGRIATYRPYIPSYDVVLLAPLIAFLFAVPVPTILIENGLHPLAAYPLCAFLGTTAFLLCPPTYADWRLTAPCRLTIGAVKDAPTAPASARRPGTTPIPAGAGAS